MVKKPVQVERIGLVFLKHYAITLPLVVIYLVLISPLILKLSSDAETAGTLLRFGIYSSFVVVGICFGSAYSLFANPFYVFEQLYHEKAKDFPREMEFSEIPRHLVKAIRTLTFLCIGALAYYFVSAIHIIGGFFILIMLLFLSDQIGVLLIAFAAFGVPLGILFWRPLKMILWHLIEETPFFVNLFRLGIGGASSRFAGIREFVKADMSEYFNKYLDEPPSRSTSDIYLGRTPFGEDVRVFGRHVGLKGTDTHMITVARIGSGKSRDALWNTILNYSGGIVCFDPKGEHYRIAGARRAKKNPVYVLDPYGSVKDLAASDHWNPLDEVDLESVAARDQIENIAASSISMDKNATDPHFQETALRIFRGLIAHVLTKYEPKDRHLGTVYDLLVTGEPEGKHYNPKAFMRLVSEMAMNDKLAGAAVEAASTLSEVGDKEKGSILSTMARGLNWINSPAIRPIISKPSTFSLREAKSKEASIFLVLPDDFISQQSRFLRTFFGLAGEVCGDYITSQPEGSSRRVLMIFDEFSALGHFKPAEEIVLRKRSAGIKCWFLLQNLSQLKEHYTNVENFITSSDKQFFGIDQADTYAMEILVKSLGSYTEGEGRSGQPLPFEKTRELFTNSDIASWTSNASNGQIVIPADGKPMKLKRVPFYQNFDSSQYGKKKTSA